jgi:excinuclease ABC subunit B
MYADEITDSIRLAIKETNRRRELQARFNQENNITPETILKGISNVFESIFEQDYVTVPLVRDEVARYRSVEEISKLIEKLRKEMLKAAKDLEFERAAEMRDKIKLLQEQELQYR